MSCSASNSHHALQFAADSGSVTVSAQPLSDAKMQFIHESSNVGEACVAIRRHRHKQPAGQQLVCSICGDEACGYNFDALTCHSCKLFFRRNAFRTLKCPFNNSCPIDKVRRKFCAACRLSKCFEAKMKREFIKVLPFEDGKTKSKAAANASRTENDVQSSGFAKQEHFAEPLAFSQASCEPDFLPCAAPEAKVTVKGEIVASASFSAPSNHVYNTMQPHSNWAKKPNSYRFMPYSCAPQQAGPPKSIDVDLASQARVSATDSTMERLRVPSQTEQMVTKDLNGASCQLPSNSSNLALSDVRSPLLRSARNSSDSCPALTEFDYDRILMTCSSGWRLVASAINAAELEHGTAKSLQNAQLGALYSLNHSLFHYFNYVEFGVRKFVSALQQVPEFGAISENLKLQLLRCTTLSVFNLSMLFIFEVDRQEWVIRSSKGDEHRIAVQEIVQQLENIGLNEMTEFILEYTRFHTEMRQVFANDSVIFFLFALLDIFTPTRFDPNDAAMFNLLNPIHAKYMFFLKRYIKRHYKPVLSNSGTTISAFPRQDRSGSSKDGTSCDQDRDSSIVKLVGDAANDNRDNLDSFFYEQAPIQRSRSYSLAARISDNRSRSQSNADSSESLLLTRYVFEKLHNHSRCVKIYWMRLSARSLVSETPLSSLLHEVLKVAENGFRDLIF